MLILIVSTVFIGLIMLYLIALTASYKSFEFCKYNSPKEKIKEKKIMIINISFLVTFYHLIIK